VGLGNCKTEVAHANFHLLLWLCIDKNPVSSLQTTLQNIIHALVFLHTSNQMVSSKSSDHEMTWLYAQF